jgi:hypothetical protein
MKSSPRVLVSLRCSATLAALAALATPALANGRSPATIDVRTRSGSTQLVAATTFGLTVSSNEGGSWQWVCEDAVGYGGTFDPDYEWSPTSGKLFATSLGGLRTTADSCTFDLDTGLAGRYIAAIAFGADGALYAAANDSTSLIYRSTDDGETFPRVSQADPPFKRYDSWLSLEVAPSDPTRVYLAGIRVAAARPTEFLLYRSIDAATNFRILPLPTFTPTMNSNIELAGVSPTDADVVYVRVTAVAGGGDAIFRSADGGSSWSALPVLAKADSLRAFVVRRDGTVARILPVDRRHQLHASRRRAAPQLRHRARRRRAVRLHPELRLAQRRRWRDAVHRRRRLDELDALPGDRGAAGLRRWHHPEGQLRGRGVVRHQGAARHHLDSDQLPADRTGWHAGRRSATEQLRRLLPDQPDPAELAAVRIDGAAAGVAQAPPAQLAQVDGNDLGEPEQAGARLSRLHNSARSSRAGFMISSQAPRP